MNQRINLQKGPDYATVPEAVDSAEPVPKQVDRPERAVSDALATTVEAREDGERQKECLPIEGRPPADREPRSGARKGMPRSADDRQHGVPAADETGAVAQQSDIERQSLEAELATVRSLLRERTNQAEKLAADLLARTAELVTERELVRERTEQAEQLLRLVQNRLPSIPQSEQIDEVLKCEGVIVRTVDVISEYDDPVFFTTSVRTMWPIDIVNVGTMFAFRASNILISSGYCPIDLDRGKLISDHTYSDIGKSLPIRYNIYKNKFSIASTSYKTITEKVVVIGGPLDGNWYHWLYSWAAKLVMLQILKPELFLDEKCFFLVHPRALEGTFGEIFATFAIATNRIIISDDSVDLLLTDATLLSFPDQSKLYPDLIFRLRNHLIAKLPVIEGGVADRRLFLSRQSVKNGRRRIHNFESVRAVLVDFNFEILNLAEMTASEQAQAFTDAEIVLGAHGSDFSDIMFCRPRTPVIVFESEDSVANGRDRGLRILSEVLGLGYKRFVTKVHYDQSVNYSRPHETTNQNYVIDPCDLRRVLGKLIEPRPLVAQTRPSGISIVTKRFVKGMGWLKRRVRRGSQALRIATNDNV